MIGARNLHGEGGPRPRDEEIGRACSSDEDSPASKKPFRSDFQFSLTRLEIFVGLSLSLLFCSGVFFVYISIPEGEYEEVLRLPRSISDIRVLK